MLINMNENSSSDWTEISEKWIILDNYDPKIHRLDNRKNLEIVYTFDHKYVYFQDKRYVKNLKKWAEVLNREDLEKIKKIGETAEELKISMYENKELNTEAQKILMGLVNEDADELIRDIINDTFVEYIDMKAREAEQW